MTDRLAVLEPAQRRPGNAGSLGDLLRREVQQLPPGAQVLADLRCSTLRPPVHAQQSSKIIPLSESVERLLPFI